MDALLEIGLSNAAAATALALVALLAGLVCRRPALAHALWLLVLLKLLTPPLFRVPVLAPPAASDPDPVGVRHPEPPPPGEAPSGADVEEPFGEWVAGVPDWDGPPAPTPEPPSDLARAESPAPAPAPQAARPPAGGEVPWRTWAGWAWLAGSAGWFVLAGRRVWRFHRGLRQAAPAPADLQDHVARLAGEVGLKRAPTLWLLPGRLTPMVWAFAGRARLLAPAELLERLDPAGRDALLVHELAHLRRRDHWVRVTEFLALGLFWWHPVAWFARRELREAEEQCCDAWVVATLPGAGRAYATALVDTLDFLCSAPAAPALASGVGRVSDLKRRLTMIMRADTPRALGWPACLGLVALAALLLPLLPGRSQAEPRPDPKPKKDFVVHNKAVVEFAEGEDEQAEVEKARAELQKAEAELRKRMEELKATQRKLRDEARKKAAEAREKARAAGEKGRAEAREKLRNKFKGKEGGAGATVIHVEVHGVNPDQVKDIAKKIESLLPGKDKRVVILRTEKDGNAFRFWVQPRPNFPPGFKPPTPPAPPKGPGPGAGPFGAPPGAGGAERRLDALEKKLEGLMRELEQMRREMKRGPGGGTADGVPGKGPRAVE